MKPTCALPEILSVWYRLWMISAEVDQRPDLQRYRARLNCAAHLCVHRVVWSPWPADIVCWLFGDAVFLDVSCDCLSMCLWNRRWSSSSRLLYLLGRLLNTWLLALFQVFSWFVRTAEVQCHFSVSTIQFQFFNMKHVKWKSSTSFTASVMSRCTRRCQLKNGLAGAL